MVSILDVTGGHLHDVGVHAFLWRLGGEFHSELAIGVPVVAPRIHALEIVGAVLVCAIPVALYHVAAIWRDVFARRTPHLALSECVPVDILSCRYWPILVDDLLDVLREWVEHVSFGHYLP